MQATDYNNNTSTANYQNPIKTDAGVGDIINLKKTSSTQLEAKKIVKKYRNLATSIIDLNNIAKLKPGKRTQIAAKKISQKYKKIRSPPPPPPPPSLPFKLTDVADAKTVDYNINDKLEDDSSSEENKSKVQKNEK